MDISKAAEGLERIVEENGPAFLKDEPYKVYQKLLNSGNTDRRTAAAILHFLVCSLTDEAHNGGCLESLSEKVQSECGFNRKTADELAGVFLMLFSEENRNKWKAMDHAGWDRFLKSEIEFQWEGCSVWSYDTGSVCCHYEAEITLAPTEDTLPDSSLAIILEKNPFTPKEEITAHYTEAVREHLDKKFDYFCNAEEYYPPAVEDFDLEDCLEVWCKGNGFELITWEGNGYDDGYEPDF